MDADWNGVNWLGNLKYWQLIGGEVIRLTSDATREDGGSGAGFLENGEAV
jgi:hypothetical protein